VRRYRVAVAHPTATRPHPARSARTGFAASSVQRDLLLIDGRPCRGKRYFRTLILNEENERVALDGERPGRHYAT